MQSFIRGQRAKISQLSSRTRRFEVLLTFCCGTIPVLDFVCFGTNAKNQLADDRYMIFFNQRRAPDGSVALEELKNQDARFSVDLDLLPPHIERLHFTASSEGSGKMSELAVSFVTLRETGIAGADAVASYRFSGNDFGSEGSLLLAEIYKKDGEWRFGAVGQGFAGNLPALLKHFGGEEIEESGQSAQNGQTAPQKPAAPTVPPAPPITVSAPLPAAASAAGNTLQKAIDDAPSGGTIELVRGEFQGPIIVNKPLVIEGNGAVIWAQNGPVVRVSSAGVTLRDLGIEATAPDESAHSDVAFWVEDGTNAILQGLRVRGEIVGVSEAIGEWKLPPHLDLGEFAPRENSAFAFEIDVPRACELKTDIAGVSLSPARVEAGHSRVEMRVGGLGNDTFLAGHVEISSGGIGRTVPLHGRSATGASVVRELLLWSVDTSPIPA